VDSSCERIFDTPILAYATGGRFRDPDRAAIRTYLGETGTERSGRPPQVVKMPPHQLLAWRKRALEQQLPTAGFPAGAGTPSLVYLWAMTLVAIVTVAGFAFHDRIDVPAAVQESQLDLTTKMSRSLNGSTGRAVADLDRTVARLRAKPPADAELLAAVVGDRQIWSGAALITTADRRPVAATNSRR